VKFNQDKRTKINFELLKDENVRKEYENKVMKNLNEKNVHMNEDLNWEKVSNFVSNAVKKAAAKSIGELKRSRNLMMFVELL